jgi:chromate transport protein ChrA
LVLAKFCFVSFGAPAGQIAIMHYDLRREKLLDSRKAFFACAKLLHGIVGTRGAAASDLHLMVMVVAFVGFVGV